jgi:hypothetical protein
MIPHDAKLAQPGALLQHCATGEKQNVRGLLRKCNILSSTAHMNLIYDYISKAWRWALAAGRGVSLGANDSPICPYSGLGDEIFFEGLLQFGNDHWRRATELRSEATSCPETVLFRIRSGVSPAKVA